MAVNEDLEPGIPAATLVLFREQPGRDAQHLMIERAGHLSFAAGALVFPGGRIEAADHDVAADDTLLRGSVTDAQDRAARVAAVRETIEEVGVAVAVEPAPDPTTLRAWREALAREESFADLLREAGAHIDLDRLVYFARWCPPKGRLHRRFDTRFYLARADDSSVAEEDHGEALSHVWMSARAMLESADSGHHEIIFPTRRNLERLAAHPTFEEAAAHARSIPPQLVMPRIEKIDGVDWLCIPADAGYPVLGSLLSDVMRG